MDKEEFKKGILAIVLEEVYYGQNDTISQSLETSQLIAESLYQYLEALNHSETKAAMIAELPLGSIIKNIQVIFKEPESNTPPV